jgi:hypothetical protein
MKKILMISILLGISMASQAQSDKKEIQFMGASSEMLQFEKDIAYFYGASDPQRIASHYLEALKQLELLGINTSDEILEKKVLPALIQAYTEVSKQIHLEFDINKVAMLELSLILSQARNESFEKIKKIMQDLYKEIFKSDLFRIQKAAMLRTFLYQYKVSILQNENTLSENDKNLMLLIAKMSEEELQNIR